MSYNGRLLIILKRLHVYSSKQQVLSIYSVVRVFFHEKSQIYIDFKLVPCCECYSVSFG